jgi:hypothetical protein
VAPRPEELERDIVLARDQLRRDVDELMSRVSPRNVAQRQSEQLRQRAGRTLRIARDEVLSRPLVLVGGSGLLVVSLATLIWRTRSRR